MIPFFYVIYILFKKHKMLVKPDLLLMGMRTLKIAISKIQTIQNIHRKKKCVYI